MQTLVMLELTLVYLDAILTELLLQVEVDPETERAVHAWDVACLEFMVKGQSVDWLLMAGVELLQDPHNVFIAAQLESLGLLENLLSLVDVE